MSETGSLIRGVRPSIKPLGSYEGIVCDGEKNEVKMPEFQSYYLFLFDTNTP